MGGSLVQGLVKDTRRQVRPDRLRRNASVSDGMPFRSVISSLRRPCMAPDARIETKYPSHTCASIRTCGAVLKAAAGMHRTTSAPSPGFGTHEI